MIHLVKVTQGYRNTNRSATKDFLLMFHSNHWPISYRFRDKRRLQSKIATYSQPMYLTPSLHGFPLELGDRFSRSKN